MDDFPDLSDPLPLLPPALLHHSLPLIPDPRDQRRPKHALPDLLFISLCSLLTGGDSFQDMADFASDEAAWLRTVIPFQGGPPSHDTFTRVFALLDTHAFEGAVHHWMRQLLPFPAAPAGSEPASPALRQVACDGKKLRGSRRGQPGALHMAATVNLWGIEEGLCLAQRRRSGYAATNLSLMRKMSLNLLLKASPPGMSLKRMRLHTARKLDQLTKILAPLLENEPNFINA